MDSQCVCALAYARACGLQLCDGVAKGRHLRGRGCFCTRHWRAWVCSCDGGLLAYDTCR